MYPPFQQKIVPSRSGSRLGFLALIAVFMLLFFLITETAKVFAAEADQPSKKQVQILLNGKPVNFDVSPMIDNGRVLVPLRAIGEALGAEVNWDGQNQEVTLKLGGLTPTTEGTTSQDPKEDLTPTQKKFSTDLVQLVDKKQLPSEQAREELKRLMQALKEFYPAGAPEQSINGKAAGDTVYVYIYLTPPVNTSAIDAYAWKVTDRDEESHLAVAWIEVKNLEALASLEAVRTIRTVAPPITTNKSAATIKLKIGDPGAFVNDKQVNLDVPAAIVSGRTMVPLRFISESLGTEVEWDELNYTVHIYSK